MFGIIRFVIITSLLYLVFRLVRRLLSGPPARDPRRDFRYGPDREVKNAHFSEDDIQDARYKDIK